MKHPAKFSTAIIRALAEELVALEQYRLLDPFAGVGGLADLRKYGWDGRIEYIEIEPEFAAAIPHLIGDHIYVGDALAILQTRWHVPCVVTSPCYGNRLADHHEAKDGSVRHSYRHDLGRPLTPGSAAGLQWGEEYQDFHIKAWRAVFNCLTPGGYFLLNVSDHVRKGKVQPVSAWHLWVCQTLGFELVSERLIPTRRLRHGSNSRARVKGEMLYIMRKP